VSDRRIDENLAAEIKALRRKVQDLERGGSDHRYNAIRIGNILLTWDPASPNALRLENLTTGAAPTIIAVP
jgi:hypothetical protein